MGKQVHVCPACGQPVDTVAGRHKTLGAWVPVWKPGPCRDPRCAAYGDPSGPPATLSAPPPGAARAGSEGAGASEAGAGSAGEDAAPQESAERPDDPFPGKP
ncbi:hypothetical protein [Streptomyces sp. NPDC005573]|uniref:hypothetical protein n=1 Tax=Streptomyces sp. NPDC005573 TaxID=3156890 RepID=UPI0033ABA2F8